MAVKPRQYLLLATLVLGLVFVFAKSATANENLFNQDGLIHRSYLGNLTHILTENAKWAATTAKETLLYLVNEAMAKKAEPQVIVAQPVGISTNDPSPIHPSDNSLETKSNSENLVKRIENNLEHTARSVADLFRGNPKKVEEVLPAPNTAALIDQISSTIRSVGRVIGNLFGFGGSKPKQPETKNQPEVIVAKPAAPVTVSQIQPILRNQVIQEIRTEKVVEKIFDESRFDLLASQLEALKKNQKESEDTLIHQMALLSQINNLAPRGNTPLVITSPTVSDVRGLTDSDIPDDITIGTTKTLQVSNTGTSTITGSFKVASEAGNVGIATSSPQALLGVGGNVLVASDLNVGGTLKVGSTVIGGGSISGNLNANVGISSSTPGAALGVKGAGIFDDFLHTSFIRATSTTATSTFDGGAVFARSAGNVGIGTSTPGLGLSVALPTLFGNNVTISGTLDLQGSCPQCGAWLSSGGFTTLKNSDDLVGVGSSTPGTKFDVVGGGLFKGNLTAEGTIKASSIIATTTSSSGFGTTTPGGTVAIAGGGTNPSLLVGQSSTGDLIHGIASDGSTHEFVVKSGGTGVGIGIADPTLLQGGLTLGGRVLQIRNNGGSAQLLLSAGLGFSPNIDLENTDATAGRRVFSLRYDGSNNNVRGFFFSESSGTAAADNVIILKNDGSVGFSTSTPTSKLEVAGGGLFKGNLVTEGNIRTSGITATSSSSSGFGTTTPYGLLTVEIPSNTKIPAFVVSSSGTSTPSFAVMPSGNVGIGTKDAVVPLHIARDPSSTNTSIELQRIERTTTGTAADNIGGYQSFFLEDNTGASIEAIRQEATLGNSTTRSFWTLSSKTTLGLVNRMQLSQYGLEIGGQGNAILGGQQRTLALFAGGSTDMALLTTAATARLRNNGSYWIFDNDTAGPAILFDTNSGARAKLQIGDVTAPVKTLHLKDGAPTMRWQDDSSTGRTLDQRYEAGQLLWRDTTSGDNARSDRFSFGLASSTIAIGATSTSPVVTLTGQYGKLGIGESTSTPFGQVAIEADAKVVGSSTPIFVVGDQGSSTPFIYVSGNNGNVGVATASPSATFAVGSNVLVAGTATSTYEGGLLVRGNGGITTDSGLTVRNTGKLQVVVGDSGEINIDGPNAANATQAIQFGYSAGFAGRIESQTQSGGGGSLIFYPASDGTTQVEAMRITPNVALSGLVGIGATSPQAKLHVLNNASASASGQEVLRLSASTNSATVGSGPTLVFTNSDGTTQAAALRTYTFGLNNAGLVFQTGYSSLANRAVIDNSGNVGIGRITPDVALDVVGTTTVSSGINILGRQLYIGNGITATSSLYGQYGNFGFGSTTPFGQVSIEAVGGNTGVGSNTPIFVIGDQGSSTPFLYVSGVNGNIGNGTSSPSATFAIEGGTASQPGLLVSKASGGDLLHVIDTTDGTHALVVQDGGSTGLGTANPGVTQSGFAFGGRTAHLQIGGANTSSFWTTSVGGGTASYKWEVTNATAGRRLLAADYVGSSNAIVFRAYNETSGVTTLDDILRIKNTGDIGIGTSTPGLKLEVAGGALFKGDLVSEGIQKSSSLVATTTLAVATTSPYGIFSVDFPSTADSRTPAFVVQDAGSSTPSIYVEGGYGRVGIGTSSPYAQLAIEQFGKQLNPAGVDNIPAFLIASRGTSTPTFIVNSNATSSVGIGTSSPQAAFAVNGDVYFTGSLVAKLGGGGEGTRAVCHTGAATPSEPEEITDCSGVPIADYAEMYPVAQEADYGDIVVTSNETVTTTQGDKIAKLIKATRPYADAIGIVSHNDSDFTSAGYNIKPEDNPKPIALNGRVTVKVNLEGGEIKIGDPITSSSEAGVGMKATKSGRIIGYALDNYSGPSPENKGRVMIFVNNSFWMSDDLATQTSDNNSNPSLLAQIIDKVGEWLKKAFVTIKELVVEKIRVGSPEKPSGITIYDLETKQPYCFVIRGGKPDYIPGECTFEVKSQTPAEQPVSNPPASTSSSSTEQNQSSATASSTSEQSQPQKTSSDSPSAPSSKQSYKPPAVSTEPTSSSTPATTLDQSTTTSSQ